MSSAPVSPPPAPARTLGRRAASRPVQPARPIQPARPVQTAPVQAVQPLPPSVTVRRVLRTLERVVLREGGHRGALVNAYAAVLEGEQRAALRADARASLQRLAEPAE